MKRADSVFQPYFFSWLLVFLGSFAFLNTAAAQTSCTLVCNNLVQVSLDEDCIVAITPAAVLQPTASCPNGQLSVTVYPMGSQTPIPTSPNVTAANIGQTLVVRVTDAVSGNSCWSNILVEDKLPPQMTCPPIHLYCNWPSAEPAYLAAFNVPNAYPKVTENCTTYTLTWSDQLENVDCNGSINGVSNISAYIKRTWVATDASGNHSVCVQWIYYDRKHVTDIDWPSDATFDCKDNDTDPAHTGIPTIDFVPLWPGSGLCELNVNYTDQYFQICEGSFKILRTWTAYDWCMPTNPGVNPVTKIQVIKFLDTHGPTYTKPADLTISTDADECDRNWDLPDLQVSDDCSSVKSAVATYTLPNWQTIQVAGSIQWLPVGNPWVLKQFAVFPVAPHLPLGQTSVTYNITDDCGNQTACSFKVTVADLVPPVAVCREFTQIGLGSDGMALPPASTFDEGSYDNCGNVYFKVRRMDANNCQNVDYFHDKAKFCCSDLNDTVIVILRVYDVNPGAGDVGLDAFSGHYNDCMVQVFIDDKVKPNCYAPADVTTTCDAFDPSLWAYGYATATDNCCIDTVTVSNSYTAFDKVCNRGKIYRTFTAKDCSGLTSKCTQIVTVNYVDDYHVKFPDDKDITTCNGSGDYGKPIIYDENCELIAINYDDKVFNLVPDACYKILRTWNIISWCSYDSNKPLHQVDNPSNSLVGPTVWNDNFNGFAYTQIIKVHDVVKPTFVNCPTSTVEFCDFTNNDPTLYNNINNWDPLHESHDLCEGPADLTATATDDCSGANLSFRYTIFADLNGDGIQETLINSANNTLGFGVATTVVGNNLEAHVTLNGSTNFELPYGLHKIKWFTSDGCGNESACEYSFTIHDCKKPTVVCTGQSVNIMNTNPAMITIWATDFVTYGLDNCTPSDQLVYGIRLSGTGSGFPLNSPSLTFDCDEQGTQLVEIWAKDKAGNADFCETYVIIQDNMGNCNGTNLKVSGFIKTKSDNGVQDANVNLKGQNPVLPPAGLFNMTGANGDYNFSGIPTDPTYTLDVKKDVNPLNGVSTLDLVAMSKHILGVKPFDSPYKWIAADINHNGAVTTFDIVELRKLILGVYAKLPANESWRFVDKGYQFTTALPLSEPFNEKISVNSTNDFVAIKIGDLTGDALVNNLQQTEDRHAAGNLIFNVKDREITAGEEVSVEFTADQAVAGYQFTMNFAGLELLEVVPTDGLSADNFGTTLANEGTLTTSFNGSEKGHFTVRFRALADGRLSNLLSLSSRVTAAEAYALDGSNLDVAFRFENENGTTTSLSTVGFELYQNEPNPVQNSTAIRFNLPEASAATLTISDASGKVIKTVRGDYAKGMNTVNINRSELKGAGVLFYQLDTPTASATKKMIALD